MGLEKILKSIAGMFGYSDTGASKRQSVALDEMLGIDEDGGWQDGEGSTIVRKHFTFRGRVQGVGFRYRAKYAADGMGITGWVRNEYDGSVEMEAQGPEAAINRMLRMLSSDSYIRIESITTENIPLNEHEKSFRYGN